MPTIVLRAKKQKVGLTKKIAYVTRAVRYNTIQASELADHASADTGVNKAMLKACFEAVLQEIRQLLLNGHSIQLGDLGNLQFSISCKTVENREDLSADLVSARRIIFRPSPQMRHEIKSVKFETEVPSDGTSPDGDGN